MNFEKPYVGITGLINPTEIEETIKAFHNFGFFMDTNHIPMIGFLMSYRTLKDIPPKKISTPNIKYLNWRLLKPRMEEVNGQALNMIHYATKEMQTLSEQVIKMFSELYNDNNLYETGICRAIQLNLKWPNPKSLEEILKVLPKIQIVQQLSKKSTEGLSSKEVAQKVHDYEGLISYALIDPSSGQGIDFDLKRSVEIYQSIKEKLPELILGFAGGLTGENVRGKIKNLKERVGENKFCIDAEGGLRDQEGDRDDLNIKKVKKYIQGAREIEILS